MDFNFKSFTTKLCSYKPVDLSDSKTILDIRKSREDSVLKNISYSSVDQDAYLESYYQRFKCKKEIYYKISLVNDNSSLGLVRLTELDMDFRFNYQSLIFKKNIPPYMPIDVIFTMYELGFMVFGKQVCGPWVVPKAGNRIYQLHNKMGIAHEIMSNDEYYFFVVTRDKFISKFQYFKKLGFGLRL